MKAAVVEALGRAPVHADFPEPQERDGAVVATAEAATLTNLPVWESEAGQRM